MLCSRSAPLLKNLCWQKNAAGTKPELPPSSAVPSSKEAQGLGRKSAFPCPSEKANLLRGDGDRLPAHHPDPLVQSPVVWLLGTPRNAQWLASSGALRTPGQFLLAARTPGLRLGFQTRRDASSTPAPAS